MVSFNVLSSSVDMPLAESSDKGIHNAFPFNAVPVFVSLIITTLSFSFERSRRISLICQDGKVCEPTLDVRPSA